MVFKIFSSLKVFFPSNPHSYPGLNLMNKEKDAKIHSTQTLSNLKTNHRKKITKINNQTKQKRCNPIIPLGRTNPRNLRPYFDNFIWVISEFRKPPLEFQSLHKSPCKCLRIRWYAVTSLLHYGCTPIWPVSNKKKRISM